MLLGKLELEPKHIPSKLAQRMAKLARIFPFALAWRKMSQNPSIKVCPRWFKLNLSRLLSPPGYSSIHMDSVLNYLRRWQQERSTAAFSSLLFFPRLLLRAVDADAAGCVSLAAIV